MKKDKMLHFLNDKDIKYRGPLTYQTLRIIAWVCFAVAQFVLVFKAAGVLFKDMQTSFNEVGRILGFFSNLPFPLFLLANFAIIFKSKNGIKTVLRNHLICCGAIFLLLNFAITYYVVIGLVRVFDFSFIAAYESVSKILSSNSALSMTINLFVDLLICSSFYFFLFYKPQKGFTGKKIIIFRLFMIIPIAIELVSCYFKIRLTMGDIVIPIFAFPLLNSKPLLTFVAFVVICLCLKFEQIRFFKIGGTEEQYEEYIKTNRHSLRFSRTISITFGVVALIDILALAFMTILFIADITPALQFIDAFDIGESASLLFVIPFVMLFSYTREVKHPELDTIIPIGGIGLTAFFLIQGFYEMFVIFGSTVVPQLVQMLES